MSTSPSTSQLRASSPLAWAVLDKLVTENKRPIEFNKHRFLIDYLSDNHPYKVSRKASQIGATMIETIDDFHEAGFQKHNVIHTLQNSDVIQGFVVPKVNPLIYNNPTVKQMVRIDSEGLKQLGDNFIYFRGCQAESQAINISADVLKIDELDRSNAKVAEMFESRLDFSDYKRIRKFSNPSSLGYGVDALFALSNQFHWFVKCHHCNHEWYIDYESSYDHNHYVKIVDPTMGNEAAYYACGRCDRELTDEDRIAGRWVAKYPSRTGMHGYWFSQFMSPWFSAREVFIKVRDNTPEYAHNFVFGKGYTPSDLIVNREIILRACSPSSIIKRDVAMGVDNGVLKTYVIGTVDGIFAHGQTKSWDDIEKMKLMYNATMVIDPNPYPTTPKSLVDKYPGSTFICYFKEDTKNLGMVQWGNKEKAGVVYADRTKILDLIAQEINDIKVILRETPTKLEDYITHWDNLYRATVEEEDGRQVSRWFKKAGKMSDYPFAHAYYRIALSRLMNGVGESSYVEPQQGRSAVMATDEGYAVDLSSDLNNAYEEASWR
jgi:hypothetical protein